MKNSKERIRKKNDKNEWLVFVDIGKLMRREEKGRIRKWLSG